MVGLGRGKRKFNSYLSGGCPEAAKQARKTKEENSDTSQNEQRIDDQIKGTNKSALNIIEDK